MPVNPTNKDAKERLKTEQKISQEQSKQNKFAEGFRDINKISSPTANLCLLWANVHPKLLSYSQ